MPSSGKKQKIGFDTLHRDIIGAGLCTACGTCVGVCPTRSIEFDYKLEEPVLSGECQPCGLCYEVCPGKDIPLADLERMVFSRERRNEENELGINRGYLKGYAIDPVVRQTGTSGGIASALLIYALETGIINGAIVADMEAKQPWRAEPKLATTRDEILAAAKSKYTIVPSNALLSEAEDKGIDRLGIVGLPCHIHGIRKMQMLGRPKKILSQVKFMIGLFCATNFSYKVTEYTIAKITGVPLEKVKKFEYRGGPDSQNAQITTWEGETKVMPSEARRRIFSRMQRLRCAVCLDFSAELADVSLGDIFLPAGLDRKIPELSAIITRTDEGEALLNGAKKSGYIRTSPLAKCGFAYNGGLEAKKYAAAFNLLRRKRFGWPTPDYQYETKYQPPGFVDQKIAIREQMKDIPELVEWAAQNPKLQEQLAEIDPEILKFMDELRTTEPGK